jgi:hypothetical protein
MGKACARDLLQALKKNSGGGLTRLPACAMMFLLMKKRKDPMPNWCYNSLSVIHEDPAQIQRFVNAAKQGRLFSEFVPLNENGEWEYGKAVDMWGTKWDIAETDFCIYEEYNSAHGHFDTAWAPPIAFYEALTEMGFEIEATFHESGMQFIGLFKDGVEKYYDYDFSNPDWRDSIDDEEILEMLENEYDIWLEWQEDENEDEDE